MSLGEHRLLSLGRKERPTITLGARTSDSDIPLAGPLFSKTRRDVSGGPEWRHLEGQGKGLMGSAPIWGGVFWALALWRIEVEREAKDPERTGREMGER